MIHWNSIGAICKCVCAISAFDNIFQINTQLNEKKKDEKWRYILDWTTAAHSITHTMLVKIWEKNSMFAIEKEPVQNSSACVLRYQNK